jgi:glucose-6-phosphate 1-dehydrogenase
MSGPSPDAIVFFGASGDLAYKQIFPALLRLVRDEGINVPVIGVAKSGWKLDDLKNRAKDSLDHHGGVDPKSFQKLADLLRYVDGDYNDAATLAALKLSIDSWRWTGVPIYIRAGKELPVTATEVTVEFKRPPFQVFKEIVPSSSFAHLRMRISPEITIGLGLRVKLPGERMVGNDVELIVSERPEADMPPYQRLLSDAFQGYGELFARQDFVDAQWRVVEPILDNVTSLYPYAPGAWGPEEAGRLIGSDGPWMNPKVSAQGEPKSKT